MAVLAMDLYQCCNHIELVLIFQCIFFSCAFFWVFTHACIAWLEWLRSWVRTVHWESTWSLTALPSVDGECVWMYTNVLMNIHTFYYIVEMRWGFLHPSMVIYCQSHKHIEINKEDKGRAMTDFWDSWVVDFGLLSKSVLIFVFLILT